jgi:ketosteroid isomerase-like protein
MSSAEKNKALVRRFLEAHANGDLEALEEMLAPDFVNQEWEQEDDISLLTLRRSVP